MVGWRCTRCQAWLSNRPLISLRTCGNSRIRTSPPSFSLSLSCSHPQDSADQADEGYRGKVKSLGSSISLYEQVIMKNRCAKVSEISRVRMTISYKPMHDFQIASDLILGQQFFWKCFYTVCIFFFKSHEDINIKLPSSLQVNIGLLTL